MLNTLSGRFLILTTVFVVLAEVLIFVPSVSRFREDYLRSRLERAQIASLALLADPQLELDSSLEAELLKNAEVFNVVLRRNEVRQLALDSPLPKPISATYDLRDPGTLSLIRDAMLVLMTPENRIIRVIDAPVRQAGLLIEITMETAPLRRAMIEYGLRILLLSAVTSFFTALLLFIAVRRFLLRPIRGGVETMRRYAAAPEDIRGLVQPSSSLTELREVEEAMLAMQTRITQALRQKDRLAQLGAAVAKISHDLRNILSSAQLIVDRIGSSEDPAVRRLAPKLVHSITRAVNLTEATLAYGRAEEPPPRLLRLHLGEIVDDVFDSERLAMSEQSDIRLVADVPVGMMLRADPEQLLRVLANLVRNARQAIEQGGTGGMITITAREEGENCVIRIADTGPGLPRKAQENLFTPFQGGARKGGTGLGLAIAAELVRGHGGRLELERTSETGTVFRIILPLGASREPIT
ncbi:sensor histidine kinase [Pontibaca methylaminivorans]|uniref:histidine kinase n=1 Tax=Pontibaca methylaminivorans TaxID=515897 RepID=A0A1R3WMF1_9RHOB|nr:HAMP domain-containing sensor histidine kinase [Pontibaca methylaminivorans]SIT79055.1 Signal transduction histidine kinase [Pontibaca methylaminivorans]